MARAVTTPNYFALATQHAKVYRDAVCWVNAQDYAKHFAPQEPAKVIATITPETPWGVPNDEK